MEQQASWAAVRALTGRLGLLLGCLIVLSAVACVEASARPASRQGAVRLAATSIPGVAPADAPNWAGYVVTADATAFTGVTGIWTQPKGACTTASDAAVAFWVGLGGSSPDTQAPEQAGTASSCLASGAATYSAWYEIAPSQPVVVALRVLPGDTITASVDILDRGAEALLQIKDRTRRAAFTTVVPLATPPDLSSAEWITESPMRCNDSFCLPVPLENFGSISFSRVAALGNGVGGTLTRPGWVAENLQLAPSTVLVTGPSVLGATAGAVTSDVSAVGRSFEVSWQPGAGD
jgi:hypothetical protein